MMSRLSSVVFGTMVLAIGVASTGCSVSVSAKSKTRFVEENVAPSSGQGQDWTGEEIKIDDAAVGASVNGGLEVIAEAGRTKIEASARMLAMANDDEKSNADQTIVDAKATFKIVKSGNTITVSCGHGAAHGSSEAGLSGCERLVVRIPAGDATTPLTLTALVGNGGMKVSAANATVASIGLNSNGGDIELSTAATKGGNVSAVSEKADDITVRLPTAFAADTITLQADADKIDKGPFSDIQTGRGTAGTGLASLKITSKEFAGSTGKITLASQ